VRVNSLSLLFAVAATLVLLPGDVSAQSSNEPPRIITSGTGEARIAPDRATILLGVQSRASTAAAASADNARRQRGVIDTLRALGLPPEQIATLNYSVSPELQYSPTGGAPKVTGYVVSNTVRADVRRIEDVARAIDASLAKGANSISSLQFYSSKADSVRRAAMTIAVANARADADALARAAGGSLGPLLELTTSFAPAPRYDMAMRGAIVQAPGEVPTPIQPGEQSITVTVTARWSFVSR
jgi:uncharacterized protein YggE